MHKAMGLNLHTMQALELSLHPVQSCLASKRRQNLRTIWDHFGNIIESWRYENLALTKAT